LECLGAHTDSCHPLTLWKKGASYKTTNKMIHLYLSPNLVVTIGQIISREDMHIVSN